MNLAATNLDPMDIRILSHLEQDGRRSFTDISNDLGVSVGMIRNRYQRLIDKGVLHIMGWTDPVKVGYNSYARINIQVKPSDMLEEVTEKLVGIPEISFVALTTGVYDIEVNMICESNKELLQTLHQKINVIEGIHETNSTIYLDVKKWASRNLSENHKDKEGESI